MRNYGTLYKDLSRNRYASYFAAIPKELLQFLRSTGIIFRKGTGYVVCLVWGKIMSKIKIKESALRLQGRGRGSIISAIQFCLFLPR